MDKSSSTSSRPATVPSYGAAFFTALRFLTVIPVSWRADQDVHHFRKSILFFPAIGLLIGFLAVLVVLVCGAVLPLQITAFVLLVYLAAISGFLHIDGLADSADGLFSARPPEVAMKIMKDSRIGAMGVVVLILVLFGKYSALSLLDFSELLTAALVLPLSGRLAILFTMASQPYGRKEGGLGELFYSSRSKNAALTGAVLLLVVSGWRGGVPLAFSVFLCVSITVVLFSWFCRSRIGGVTGDTLGAVCEITELMTAITLCSL